MRESFFATYIFSGVNKFGIVKLYGNSHLNDIFFRSIFPFMYTIEVQVIYSVNVIHKVRLKYVKDYYDINYNCSSYLRNNTIYDASVWQTLDCYRIPHAIYMTNIYVRFAEKCLVGRIGPVTIQKESIWKVNHILNSIFV